MTRYTAEELPVFHSKMGNQLIIGKTRMCYGSDWNILQTVSKRFNQLNQLCRVMHLLQERLLVMIFFFLTLNVTASN